MKKTWGKIKRTISVLLAAAMIITALPQTSVPVYASEAQDVLDEGGRAAESAGEDKENNTGSNDADGGGNTGSEEKEIPDQSGSDETGDTNQTGSEEADSTNQTGAEETETSDENGSEETEIPEEDPDLTVADEDLTEDGAGAEKTEETEAAEQSGRRNTVSILSVDDGIEAQTGEEVTVRLNIPRYGNVIKNPSFLLRAEYAIGDSEDFTRVRISGGQAYVDITAKADEKLRVKLTMRDRAQIEEVSYGGLEEGAEATPITPEDAENHIYAIETIPAGSGTDPVYQINIKADYHYTLRFVDVYASKHPGEQNNKSVSFYQYAKDVSAAGSAEGTDLIGQTLELSGQEMQEFFSEEKYNYALEVQEGYTFYSIDANTSSMRFRYDKSNYENGYILSGAYDLGADDITVFVLAEPTQDNRLKFNIPEELQDKVEIEVTYSDPAAGPSGVGCRLEPEDNGVSIASDRKVWFHVTVKDLNQTVRATCEENGADAAALPYRSREAWSSGDSNGWKNWFYLQDADASMKNGDVVINLEALNMYPVTFHLTPEEISRITVYEPVEQTFRNDEYGESGSCTAWVAEGEQLQFTVYPDTDTTFGSLTASTSEDGSGELQTGWNDYDEEAYIIAPTEPTSVYLTMSKGFQYQLDYDADDFSVKVCDKDGNPIEVSADNKFVSAQDVQVGFRIMVKMNGEKWDAVTVTYEDELNERKEAERNGEYDDAGYLCYVAEEVGYQSYGSSVITIEGYNTHTITFAGNEEAVKEGVWLNRYQKDNWGDWEYIDAIDLKDNKEFKVKDGEEVYFSLNNYSNITHRIDLSLSGSGGQLEVCEDEDWNFDRNGTLYHFTPAGDVTITAELTARQRHTVIINSGADVTDFKVSGNGKRPEGETGNAGIYFVYDGDFITISKIAGSESTAGHRGKVVCTTDGKSYEVPMKYKTVIDGTWEDGAYFAFEVTADMTVEVDLVPVAQPVITFADTDKITSVKIWEFGDSEQINLYNSDTKQATLSDDKEYRLDFQLQDGYAAKSVVLKDESSGEERVLERDEEWEHRIYEIGVPQGDAQITIEAVQGYTVMFDIPAGADITFAEDLTDYGNNDITKDSVQVMATDSFPFTMDGEGRYKLSVDSDAFTLEKILKRTADSDYYVTYYQYVLKPVAGAQLPATVKVKAEEYAKHTVTLDYPEEIKTIYLTDDTGETYEISGKQAEVQGISTVLGVKAINGYAAKVSVQGKTTGESKELTPFRLAEEDVSEYYLGELSEDVTITVTAERSTQKLTYYKVGFYSAGNGVKIRDAGTKTLYSANEDYDPDVWEEFEYPYSILKGSSISFTVEPREGYEIDGVYANGEVVKPVQNVLSQQDVYTVVPLADTLITVKISQIAEKYPITFTYPAAVKSVTVKDYELTDQKLEVKAGTKLAFTVELADTSHRITSVTMNGKEAAYNKNSGSYSIVTVAEPMEVIIETAENIDKTVTFKNTVTAHMIYSVATNAQVTESGTDTYTIAALASVLRFTVTSAKKEFIPAVSYVNAAGVKTVLQEKTKTESDATIAYTYEIPVSGLAAASEVVIEETIVASAEDKAKLEACIGKYKDKYNQEEYTSESWAVYAKALKAAEDCMKKENATKAEVEAAIANLENAVKELTQKGEEPAPGTKEGLWFEILENPETDDGSYIYTGAAIKPEIKVYHGKELLQVKKDYTVTYKNNTNAGTATITVTGKGNFKGNDTATFEIEKKDISSEDITAADVYAVMKANGTVANPKVTVKFGKKTLKANNDYKVIYPELEKDADGKIIAKDYEITISTTAVKKKNGEDVDSVNYTGSREITYTVCANDIKLMSKAKISLTANSVDYAERMDAEKRPQVKSVKISGKEIPLDDLTITETDYEQAGKATITVEGKDKAKYYGSKTVTYTVNGTKLAAKELKIEGIDTNGYDYTGKPIFINAEAEDPAMRTLKVTRTKANGKPIEGGGTLLTEGTDYEVSYKTGKKLDEHTNAGTVTVTITGINAYTGSVSKTFKIKPIDLAAFGTANAPTGLKITAEPNAKYTKTGAKPAITELTFNGEPLVEKQDYTVSYTKNTTVKKDMKSATMTIKGKGNFKGSYKHMYEVTIASEADVYATAVDIVKPAKFNQLKPVVKVYESTGKALKAGIDYDKTVTYYSDAACTRQITADNFNKPVVEGGTETPTDINKVIYAKIVMKGNYAGTTGTPGTVTAAFRVYNKDLKMTSKKLVITVDTTKDKDGKEIVNDGTKNKNPYYTGTEIEPKVTVTLKGSGGAADQTLTKDVDYEVAYTNNKNKGKATVTVTGIGNGYGGSKSLKFTIVPKNMDWAEQAAKAAQKALEVFTTIYE